MYRIRNVFGSHLGKLKIYQVVRMFVYIYYIFIYIGVRVVYNFDCSELRLLEFQLVKKKTNGTTFGKSSDSDIVCMQWILLLKITT